MKKPLVVDASAALNWILQEELAPQVERLIAVSSERLLLAPSCLYLEAVNGAIVAERRNRLAREEVEEALALLEQMPLVYHDSYREMAAILEGCRVYGLSAYDAAYLALALAHACPLVTLDNRLAAAADAAGLPALV